MKSMTLAFLVVIAATVGLRAGRANAGTLSAGDIFSQFDAVIFGNFRSTADVEGRAVVGGNLTGGATFANNPSGVAASSFAALTVYGNAASAGSVNIDRLGGVAVGGNNNVTFNLNNCGSAFVGGSNSGAINGAIGSIGILGANSGRLQLSGSGSTYVGGSNSGNINVTGSGGTIGINGGNNAGLSMNGGTIQVNGGSHGDINHANLSYTGSFNGNLNGGATATSVPSISLTAPTSTLGSFATMFQTPLTALSTRLAGVAANSRATVSGNAVTFNAAPDALGTAVFDINTSLFSGVSGVTINLNGAKSVIINVDSCTSQACAYSFANGVNFNNPTSYAAHVLWNFINASSLTFGGEFGGSVLAPLAAVTNSSPIDGTLVAVSFSGSGEVHSDPYVGSLPSGGQEAVAAPEPAALSLVGTGMAGLALIRRRNKAKRSRTEARMPMAQPPNAPEALDTTSFTQH